MISNDAKLLAVYNNLEKQIKALQLKHGVDGNDGADGISIKGDQGDRGHDGVGHDGKQGVHGADGSDGSDGSDGVSITEASIDFDNHLVIKLSNGSEIDAGEIKGGSGGDRYMSNVGGGGRGPAGVGTDLKSFYTNITVPVGTSTLTHNMNLINRNAFMINFMVDNTFIVYGFTSVDVNSITIDSSLLERENVSIFMTGLGV